MSAASGAAGTAPPGAEGLVGRIAPRIVAGSFALLTLQGVGEVAAGMRSGAVDAYYPDFEALLLAGRLAIQGRLAEAYSWPTMSALERADGIGADAFLPFAYPPPFALAMSGLCGLPGWAAYLAFDLAGLALFLAVLARLSPGRFWPLAAAVAPACSVGAIAGQNGALLAALAGLSTVSILRDRSLAGGSLAGLLGASKPQLAAALPLLFLVRRDWRAAAAAAATAAAAMGLSAAMLGPSAVTGFLAGLSETGRALAEGRFPLHRMVSVYAFLRSFGVPSSAALAAHAAAAVLVLSAVAVAARRLADARAVAGLCLVTTAFVSPYFYDYDTPVFGLGLALALPAGGGWRAAVALAALGLAGYVGSALPEGAPHVSLGAPLLLVALGAAIGALRAGTAAVSAAAAEA